MSTKKQWFKGLKKADLKETPRAPRSKAEIDNDINQVANRAYKAQYTIFVYQKDLEQCNNLALSLNQEAAARMALDAKAQPAPQQTGTTNEQA